MSLDSCTIELVSNASLQLFLNNTQGFFSQIAHRSSWTWMDNVRWKNSEISYTSMYQKGTEGKFIFFDEKLSKTTEPYCLQPGLYSSINDIVKTMNTINEERNNQGGTCIRINADRITQKSEVYLAKNESILATCTRNLGPVFGGGVQNDLGILVCGKGLHKPTFAYVCVRIHSRMIYNEIVE